ncbi:ABC transporter permease [Parendozoicomonas haliclonae]|uniref:Iron export permease protein FetB n=1 Tax=Parendozoicomonas haliclonae TaxID=1960125 RepID=A0A1X7ANA7_9GAMM|nr:ABC transporter permease [Parendozoicomonas haliclonae]SMA49599.1 hypothetical protein EHSB41UT_03384 [Parendozoicomonas haliclonae]
MSTTADIGLLNLALFLSLLGIPCLFFWRWRMVDLSKDTIVSVLRMTVQLLLVGFYLRYLFRLDNVFLNIGWLMVMITVANTHIVRRSGLVVSRMFWVTQLSLMIAVILMVGLFLWILIPDSSLVDARYLIPIAGMVLGNCLQGNIRALDAYFTELKNNENAFMADLLQGATVREASEPAFQKAMRSSIAPNLGNMATLGIVSLPGMMTGQMLGGALPLVAAKYQIAIMAAIFMAIVVAISLNLMLCLRVAYTPEGLIDKSIFKPEPS